MTGSIRAELLVMRKRLGNWILLGIWAMLALLFAYLVPYVTYLNGSGSLEALLPEQLVGTVMGGFPFFGGMLALMLAVLAVGSEYGWGTLRMLLSQRPGRLRVFGAKMVALAVALVAFVGVVFAAGALASTAIALREGAATQWPSTRLLLGALAAGWLILAAWAALGVLLAVLSRGTALAIGVGILWGLVIERLVSILVGEVTALDRLVDFFLRANAYSLVTPLGVSEADIAGNGPGAFEGPFVGGGQALLVLVVYTSAFLLLSGWLVRRRDVA